MAEALVPKNYEVHETEHLVSALTFLEMYKVENYTGIKTTVSGMEASNIIKESEAQTNNGIGRECRLWIFLCPRMVQ